MSEEFTAEDRQRLAAMAAAVLESNVRTQDALSQLGHAVATLAEVVQRMEARIRGLENAGD